MRDVFVTKVLKILSYSLWSLLSSLYRTLAAFATCSTCLQSRVPVSTHNVGQDLVRLPLPHSTVVSQEHLNKHVPNFSAIALRQSSFSIYSVLTHSPLLPFVHPLLSSFLQMWARMSDVLVEDTGVILCVTGLRIWIGENCLTTCVFFLKVTFH